MIQAVAIVGPTAVGKSDVADELARRLGSEVISADAMQVYRGMDIGTGKMPPEERQAPLVLIDVVDAQESYSAALFQRDARREIDRLLGKGALPILCGGTGLYLRAALDEMSFPAGDVEAPSRSRYQELAEEMGAEGIHALLAQVDPESAACIHPHNVRRVVRALEMHDEGVSYARQKERFSTPTEHYHALYFGLTRERSRLYERIDVRVDGMLSQGLLQEVERLVSAGCADAITSRQAIGYKELYDYLEGLCSLDEAVQRIKQRSRNYAKRQLSWFRRDARIIWLDMDELSRDDAVDAIQANLERS